MRKLWPEEVERLLRKEDKRERDQSRMCVSILIKQKDERFCGTGMQILW